MGFEQAHEALEADLKAQAPGGAEAGLSPETENSSVSKEESKPEILDLDTLERVKYKGKEWAREDLDKAFLMQSDYTKKTQALAKEREAAQKEQEFQQAFRYDLPKVLGNPALAAEFKKVYPESYHELLDLYLKNQPQQAQTGAQTPQVDPRLEERMSRFETFVEQKEAEAKEARVTAYEAEIETTMKTLSTKYPLADEEAIISRAQTLLSQGEKLTQETWDKIAKHVNDRNEKLAEKYYKGKVDSQKQASAKGRDVASGGSTPLETGKKLSFKEATAQAIRDFSGKS